uniref:Myotubularin phosphatase domain-containing protein n=1 Tax=Anser brachyrhynchus TaxID=132585 RepID=A0A8B9BU07_9AVES
SRPGRTPASSHPHPSHVPDPIPVPPSLLGHRTAIPIPPAPGELLAAGPGRAQGLPRVTAPAGQRPWGAGCGPAAFLGYRGGSQLSPNLLQPPGSVAPLQSEHNVALPCIRKLVAGSSFTKPKVLTAASTLKFIPEELLIFCRDFRLLRFHFHENGLAPQAYRVANAIAQARETATWPGDSGDGDGRSRAEAKAEEEEEEEGEDEEGSAPTLLFESLRDWEKELKRQGAAGWRVSAINERFDMAPSLPRYLWVPSGLLDHDLKRTFAHFEERRVPRLCWHHPGGSDLLRSAGFHAASEPGGEDVRCLEALLRAGRGPCVLADAAELPTLADIQLAHLKLWALCLHGAAAEEKWLSALEATRW